MTTSESKQHAERCYKIIQNDPELKLLVDLVHADVKKGGPNTGALTQFATILFDYLGVHCEQFEKLKKDETPKA